MADDAALSVDQAVNLLRPEPEAAPEEAAPAPETEATPEIEASPPEADDTSEAEEPGDDVEAEEQEPEAPVVKAPHWWTAEEKAEFAQLTPEMQARVVVLEERREQAVTKAKGEAEAVRKAAETEATQAKGVLDALGKVVPQWVETFKSRWDNVDWKAWAASDPAAYVAGKAQYDDERAQIEQALQTQEIARQTAQATFFKERAAALPALVPELVDPVKGEKNQTDLSQYLIKEGFSADTIRMADAPMMRTAWKAFKYDQVQASLKAKTTPAPQRQAVAPAAAQQRTSQVRSAEQLNARLNKSGSIDDAVALLQGRRK